MKQEMLSLNEIHEENGIKITTLQTAIKSKKLKATKIGSRYMVTRENLNTYLGITNKDELLEKDLEIARLKNQLEGYKRQYDTLKQLINTMQGLINVL